jgi:F-type H+-transporting ATPase subunit delta
MIDAYECHQLEKIRLELNEVSKGLKTNPLFGAILNMPTLTVEKKKALIKETFSAQISDLLLEFLVMLVEKKCFNCLENIVDLYDQTVGKCLEELANMIEGEVYSAMPLGDEQLEQLNAIFSKKLDIQVKFVSVVDESLIGGYRVKIKDWIYDDTIKLQLKQLSQSLKEADWKEEVK